MFVLCVCIKAIMYLRMKNSISLALLSTKTEKIRKAKIAARRCSESSHEFCLFYVSSVHCLTV